MTKPQKTIREIMREMFADEVIADYRVLPYYIRAEFATGSWLAVSPDTDPENPDRYANGYCWTVYTEDSEPTAYGGDETTETLADTIRKLSLLY